MKLGQILSRMYHKWLPLPEPKTVLCKFTDGHTTYTLVCPVAESIRMSPEMTHGLGLLVEGLAKGECKMIGIPPYCRVVVSTVRPEYDPPTDGELGL